MKAALLAAAVLALSAGAHASPAERALGTSNYTLYRTSLVQGVSQRVHVGSFDAAEKAAYNQGNCLTAADLFQHQPGVLTRFWCEAGGYKP